MYVHAYTHIHVWELSHARILTEHVGAATCECSTSAKVTSWIYTAQRPPTQLDWNWCCFYYFLRNSLVDLLEALCAQRLDILAVSVHVWDLGEFQDVGARRWRRRTAWSTHVDSALCRLRSLITAEGRRAWYHSCAVLRVCPCQWVCPCHVESRRCQGPVI